MLHEPAAGGLVRLLEMVDVGVEVTARMNEQLLRSARGLEHVELDKREILRGDASLGGKAVAPLAPPPAL